MACQTTVYGQGGDCPTGGPLGNFGSYVFAGKWTQTTVNVCSRSWIGIKDANGVNHPNSTYYAFHPSGFSITYQGCDIVPNQPYDCVNGGCVPKETYKTPGAFASLAACQSGCAKNSNCTGECVNPAELAALQQAASNLQSKICG